MPAFVRAARAAFTFLTVVPVGGFPFSDATWRWAAAWFPLVGAFVGALGAGVFVLLEPASTWVAAVAAVVSTIMVTGAFHEDGLADSADALGGAFDRERLFVILKDSRIGTYGALALTSSVAFRVSALAELGSGAPFALILVHSMARTTPVWMMASIPYVTSRDTSKSRPVIRTGRGQAVFATVLALAVAAYFVASGWISPGAAGGGIALLAVVGLLAGRYFVRRAGGITGDFLGATEQVNEVALLVGLLFAS